MEEKELIRRVRNSFKAKKSRAEILTGFQKRGYKLAYADELIRKAKRPKRIISVLAITMVLFFSLTFSVYTLFSDSEKMELSNPMTGFVIAGESITENSLVEDDLEVEIILETEETTYSEIEITTEFVSFLLNELGAWKLHKNPVTLQDPIINFRIEEDKFYSVIGTDIQTYEGISDSADLTFDVNKEDLIDSIMAENSKDIFVESISSGRTSVDILTGEADLFAKGYLELYDTLNPESPL